MIYRFMANRSFETPQGQGKIRMFVKTGSETAEGDYACPACKKSGKINQPFKRPIQVRCDSCGFLLKLARLKDEMKKEKLKEKKAKETAKAAE